MVPDGVQGTHTFPVPRLVANVLAAAVAVVGLVSASDPAHPALQSLDSSLLFYRSCHFLIFPIRIARVYVPKESTCVRIVVQLAITFHPEVPSILAQKLLAGLASCRRLFPALTLLHGPGTGVPLWHSGQVS